MIRFDLTQLDIRQANDPDRLDYNINLSHFGPTFLLGWVNPNWLDSTFDMGQLGWLDFGSRRLSWLEFSLDQLGSTFVRANLTWLSSRTDLAQPLFQIGWAWFSSIFFMKGFAILHLYFGIQISYTSNDI